MGGGGQVQRPAARLARRRPLERRADGPAEPDRAAAPRSTYYPGMVGLPDAASPPMLQQVVDDHGGHRGARRQAEGMIVTHGGLEGGYGLYLRDGKPTFVYNFLAVDRPTFAGEGSAAEGQGEARRRLRLRRRRHAARAATVTITANGKKVAEGRLERTIPIQFSLGEGLDIGMDSRLAGGLHLQAAVRVHRQDREGDGRAETRADRPRRGSCRVASSALTGVPSN